MKKFGLITTLVALASTMTLVSCGGEGAKQKAYVSFAIYGDHIATFSKEYDGQPASIDVESVNTNSDGELAFKWQQAAKDESGADIMQDLESAPVMPGSYYVEVSVPETSKFLAAKTGHDYTITKAKLPEAWITTGAAFPETLHFTKSGSGRNTRRTPNADEVALIKENITVNDGTKTWVLDTDYTISVSIASGNTDPATGTISISPVDNPLYSAYSMSIAVAVQTA